MKPDVASSNTTTLILLAEIGEAIGANLPLDAILNRVASALTRLLPSCDAVSIVIPDIKNQAICFRAAADSAGQTRANLIGLSFPIDELPTIQTMLHTGELLYLPDVHQSPLWRAKLSAVDSGSPVADSSRAMLGIPLIIAEQIVGLLFIDFFSTDPLTDDARYTALAFARYAATAIHNAQQRDNIRRSEERYRLVANLTSNAIYEWIPGAATIEWSGDIDRLLHYTPGEFPRTVSAWLDAIHPDDRRQVKGAREVAVREGGIFEAEYRLRRADGVYCRVLDRAIRFGDPSSPLLLGVISDLSDLYELTDALISSGASYRTIFIHSLDAIFVIDDEGRIIDTNPSAEVMTGRNQNQLLALKITDLALPQEANEYREMLDRLRHQGAFPITEMCLSGLNHEVVHIELWGTALGKNIYQIVAHDVSARQREQALVAQRTAELVALSDLTRATAGGGDLVDMLRRALPDAMSALEMPIGGIYLRAGQNPNLRLVAHVGFEPGTLALYPPLVPIAAAHRGHATDLSILVRIIDHAAHVDGGLHASLQVPLVSSNNIMGLVVFSETKPRTFLATDIRLMDIIGRQLEVGVENVRLVAELEDLVQERTSALLATEVRYKSLIEQVPGVVYTASTICNGLTFISSGTDDLFGLSPTEMLQSQGSLLGRINADDLAWVRQAADRAIAENREFDAQYRIVDARTGGERWVHHCARRVKMIDEDSAFWLGLLTDVTRLKELDNLKNQFVATVSHELRTPLSVIKLRATTLENYYDRLSDQARLDMVRRITHQSDILTDLIEDVLRLARLDSGSAERQLDNVDVVGVGADVVEELQPSAQSNGLKFEASWPSGKCIVCADTADIARIWRNLIGNAIKYTATPGRVSVWAGGVTLDSDSNVTESALPAERLVMPSGLKPGSWIVGIVEDTGQGISEQDQEHIFTRFFRGEAALTNIPGSGLGLSLVKEVLGEYGGRVALRSRSGHGSTFVFWLPAVNVVREMRQ